MLRFLLRIVGIFIVSSVAAMLTSPSATAHVGAYLDGGGPGETGLSRCGFPQSQITRLPPKWKCEFPTTSRSAPCGLNRLQAGNSV